MNDQDSISSYSLESSLKQQNEDKKQESTKNDDVKLEKKISEISISSSDPENMSGSNSTTSMTTVDSNTSEESEDGNQKRTSENCSSSPPPKESSPNAETFNSIPQQSRLAMILLSLQISTLMPQTGYGTSKKWIKYGETLANMYDPEDSEKYQTLAHQSLLVVQKLTSFHFTASAGEGTFSDEDAQDPHILSKWVKDNVISGIKDKILALSPQFKGIVTNKIAIASIIREVSIIRFFWEPIFEHEMLSQNPGCDMNAFKSFTSAQRYLCLTKLNRISNTISDKIFEAMPPSIQKKLIKMKTREFPQIYGKVPISLEEYLEFFQNEITSLSNDETNKIIPLDISKENVDWRVITIPGNLDCTHWADSVVSAAWRNENIILSELLLDWKGTVILCPRCGSYYEEGNEALALGMNCTLIEVEPKKMENQAMLTCSVMEYLDSSI